MKETGRMKLESIQGLRFFAAFLVVTTHITNFIDERINGQVGDYWRTGLSGVDIFFVISGFIMAYTTKVDGKHDWVDFLMRRITRIVPLYWIATLLKVMLVMIFPQEALHSANNTAHIIASFAFIPWTNMDHEYLPVIPAGWTLNYEMFYYVLFTVALFMKIKPLIFCGLVFFVLTIVGNIFSISGSLGYYSDSIVFEFIYGMLIAFLIRRNPHGYDAYMGGALILLGSAVIFLVSPTNWVEGHRSLIWGGAGSALVSGALFIERHGINFVPQWVVRLGDASYSLYLFHAMIIPGIILVCLKLGIKQYAVIFVLAMFASLSGSYLIYMFVEKPLTEWFKVKRRELIHVG